MVESVKVRPVRLIVGLIVLLIGIAVLVAGILMWRIGGVDKYIKLESFSIKDQPVDKITELEISIGSGDLIINKGGDRLDLIAENVPEGYYSYGTTDGRFYIKQKSKLHIFSPYLYSFMLSDKSKPRVTLTVPDKEFDRIKLELGAGEATVDGLKAKNAEIHTGAGDFNSKNFNVSDDLEIEHGVGRAVFEDYDAGKIDIESGIGELIFSGYVRKGMDAECGIGEVDMTVYGSSSDYDIDAKSGIGSVNIERNGGDGKEDIPFDIEGGIGEVNIRFVNK